MSWESLQTQMLQLSLSKDFWDFVRSWSRPFVTRTGVQRSLQRIILDSSLDITTRNGKTEIAVLKDASCGVHGTISPLPLFYCFILECCVFQDVCPSFGCMTGQLQNCAICQPLREDCRGSHSVKVQMVSVGGLSHCGVGCVWHCHPEASQMGINVEVWKMVGRFLGLPWFPANPTYGVIVGF